MAASSTGFENHENDLFYLCVKTIFDKWTALNYAVHMGHGGIDSAIKAKWMRDVVHKFFYENDNLYPDEVEDFMADILNAEFNTIADDGSLTEISEKLCRFFRLYKVDNLHGELLTFVTSEAKQNTKLEQSKTLSAYPETGKSGSPLETNFDGLNLVSKTTSENGSANTNNEMMDTNDNSDDDGEWKTITRGRAK